MPATLPMEADDPPRKSNRKGGISDSERARITDLWLQGGQTIDDIVRRTGSTRRRVISVVNRAAAHVARDMNEEDRYAERWVVARRARLAGLAQRMREAQNELAYAKIKRAEAEGELATASQVVSWTRVIGAIDDRIREIMIQYTDAMAAIPPAQVLNLEISGEIEDMRRTSLLNRDGPAPSADGDGPDGRAPAGADRVPEEHPQGDGGSGGGVCPAGPAHT